MSRSYKKHGYDSICSSYGDKYCRSHYHRSDRRKTKKILEEVTRQWIEIPYSIEGEIDSPISDIHFLGFDWREHWEEIADKLITKGKDYSLCYADKWSWVSDGGVYFQGNLSTAHQDFDKCCLGACETGSHRDSALQDFYKDYCRNRDASRTTSIWKVSDYALSQNIIPGAIQNPKDLKDYLIAHREEICKGWLRRRFSK